MIGKSGLTSISYTTALFSSTTVILTSSEPLSVIHYRQTPRMGTDRNLSARSPRRRGNAGPDSPSHNQARKPSSCHPSPPPPRPESLSTHPHRHLHSPHLPTYPSAIPPTSVSPQASVSVGRRLRRMSRRSSVRLRVGSPVRRSMSGGRGSCVLSSLLGSGGRSKGRRGIGSIGLLLR
jgi:hypothetical protein